ncbi:MAG: serine/threonine protein kinase, partial [Actinobacteria bacterium]|nr:serine/threonine protein kinase [Actinomycetota bacterium]
MASAVASFPASDLVLGRYRPLRSLGSGGSGSVWLARDEQNGLDVALKIVAREGKADSRAEREASAAARLRHPRCLRAYSFAGDDRNVYIAYEYVPGRTLRDRLRGGELTDASVVEAAAQILDGLAHAHGHGIVHRDVKPTNVLVADGPEVSIRLLDFGLAQFAEAETLTAAGDVPGTLAYISPERLKGETASPAADIWAVGILLWESLAGYHPFWTASPVETARRIDAGPPPLESVRPDLPKSLTDAVARATAVDPRRRPTAVQLADRLRSAWDDRERRRTRATRVATTPPVRRAA